MQNVLLVSKLYFSNIKVDCPKFSINFVFNFSACIDAGIGCDQINTFLSGINVPAISKNLYNRAENDIGPAIEKVAIRSCEKALEEERLLTIQIPLCVFSKKKFFSK